MQPQCFDSLYLVVYPLLASLRMCLLFASTPLFILGHLQGHKQEINLSGDILMTNRLYTIYMFLSYRHFSSCRHSLVPCCPDKFTVLLWSIHLGLTGSLTHPSLVLHAKATRLNAPLLSNMHEVLWLAIELVFFTTGSINMMCYYWS